MVLGEHSGALTSYVIFFGYTFLGAGAASRASANSLGSCSLSLVQSVIWSNKRNQFPPLEISQSKDTGLYKI